MAHSRKHRRQHSKAADVDVPVLISMITLEILEVTPQC